MTMTNNYLCPWYAINMTSVPQVTTFYFWRVNWCAAYLQNMPGAQVSDWCAKKFPLQKIDHKQSSRLQHGITTDMFEL